jgi:hypothetical protein
MVEKFAGKLPEEKVRNNASKIRIGGKSYGYRNYPMALFQWCERDADKAAGGNGTDSALWGDIGL